MAGEPDGPYVGLITRGIAIAADAAVINVVAMFAGYILVLFDDKRRGLQDRMARTVVIEAPQLSYAEARRQRRGSPTSGDDRRKAPSQA